METFIESLDNGMSIIGLTETWFNDSTRVIYGITGYNRVEKHRIRIDGGVALFIRDDLTFSKKNDLAHFHANKDVKDHSPVSHIHMTPNDQETEVYFMKRIWDMKNNQALIESFAETDWSEIYNATSTEIAFNAFHTKLMNLLYKCSPNSE